MCIITTSPICKGACTQAINKAIIRNRAAAERNSTALLTINKASMSLSVCIMQHICARSLPAGHPAHKEHCQAATNRPSGSCWGNPADFRTMSTALGIREINVN